MSSEKLLPNGANHDAAIKSDALPPPVPSSPSLRCGLESTRVFEELPRATIVSVSRPDASDFSPLLLSYTIEIEYKQFKWCLLKKASQLIYLHFALKKRAIIEELHEKQEQVKEWLHSIGIGDQTAVIHDNDEPDDGAVPVHHEDMATNKYVPSRAALPIIRPALGAQQTFSENAKVAMQGYLNHFLGHMDIVNSREVCKFLEVSKLSFSKEYGPKLKEGYVMVKHLPKVQKDDVCCPCRWLNCCNNKWQKVWAVLKPGFLALLEDPFDTNLLDIVVFDMLPTPSKDGEPQVHLAHEIKNRNPLRYSFKVSCGSRRIKLRTTSSAKVKAWISSVNAAALMPTEGWCHPHRFGSYAPPRGLTEDGSQAQWFVDGQAAFEAIAASIESAKSEVYITGWWVCPELYLKRPFDSHGFSRLDALLEAKAKQGVQIYILLYKEVALALKINSLYSKRRLLDIHENVKVLRYPDHFSAGVYLWSHHEKLVIVDFKICFFGGLDLCFGRYDTAEHRVGDCPPYIWPGKDYYNPRESEPNSWEDTMKDELDREKYPRMPWHDVHCAIRGPPCRDIARHFVQRWNHAKRSKAPNEQSIPLLMPHHHMVLPHYMGRSKEINIANKTEIMETNLSKPGAIFHQSPSENIPLLLPREADEIKISKLDDKINELNSYQHQNHLDQPSNAAQTHVSQVGPPTYCRCQVIRSVSQWSAGTYQTEDSIHRAYCSLIEKAEHFVYIENQFFISGLSGDDIIQNRILEALYGRIMRAHNEQKCFRVIIVIPLLPGFQGGLDDSGAATVRAIMHWQYRTICRGKHSILHRLKASLGPKTGDYISFCGLRTYGRLSDEGPPVTSQIYVHSKVLIIDDWISVIGSSNINDRSLLGSRDSEIAVVIEDKEFLESAMNGEPWKAGKFASSLRLSLWSEHLGLCPEEVARIRDPIADSTYKDLWQQTAKDNAAIYQDVFGCTPNDVIRSRSKLRESIGYWKEKVGHTTIDLGVAPKKIEIIQEEGVTKTIDPMEKLNSIRGFLVVYPLEFMSQEDLRPNFVESEFYASPQVFY